MAMAINYPGPYELRIGYTVGSLTTPTIQHVQRLNVDVVEPNSQGAAFSAYNFEDINGVVTNTLNTLVEDWLTLFNAMFHTSMNIDFVELWKYPTPQSFDAVFWSSYVPTANAGTNAGAAVSAAQDIYVFRSQEGGIMKLSLMDGSAAAGAPQAYASLGAAPKALVDFVIDGDGVNYSAPFLARDTSFPFSFKQRFPGQNEAVWKKRNGRD
jgi:hypothetical protein